MGTEKMNPEEIFNVAVEISDTVEQGAYLDKVCGEDRQLRAEVEALLKAHKEAGDFLEAPAFGANVTLDSSAMIEGPGTIIGRYKLLELIGEGGMGLVYLAEQQEPIRRKVALKIVKLGMDTKQVIARFEAERQALAVLDHPNIAHVYDAGTTETGRPYFVMEYVKGVSITKYCDEHKLNIEQRLRLFEQVCEGVHHAHQKGIIHRDLKPSNILVSVHGDRAVPKIIDFGIAKAITQPLTDKTFVTFQDQLLGTPQYMSPEQVDMATQDIDTRSDIYSLGVVLYELLAGVLPFEKESFERAGFAEIQRTIRELEPASPSIRLTSLGEKAKTIAASRGTQVITLARRLHRELEWIPLKAMRKDRCRRYKSASEMADDIRNYLDGNPLIAGPETAIYRVKKFVRKHVGSVTTVALVAVAIIFGLVISTAMFFRAEQARMRAEDAEKVAQEQRKLAEDRAEDYRRSLYVNRINLADAYYREGNIRRVRELLDACPNDLRGWEWNRLDYISDPSIMTFRGHKGWVYSVALSPDGKRMVSTSWDKTIKIWDTSTGDEVMTLRGHKERAFSASFSPDGKRIVSGGYEGIIKVWDTDTGGEVMTLRGHDGWIWSVVFSPDDKRIVSGGDDSTVRVWDAATGAEVMTLRGHEGRVRSVSFSPDGKRIVSGSYDKTVKVWDTTTGEEMMTLRGDEHAVLAVAFSPDGKRIVSGGVDRTVKLWDAATGSEVMTLSGHRNYVPSVSFSPDSKRIVSGSWDHTLKVWDATTGAEVVTLNGHSGIVSSAAFSPDGQRIVSSSFDEKIKVWDPAANPELITLDGHKDLVSSVAFSPDGRRIVSSSRDKTIKLWDARTGAEVITLRGHNSMVWSVAFSPDGQRIVSSSGNDGVVKVWDAATGVEMLTLQCRKAENNYLSISPDSKTIAFPGDANSIKVWDLASGAEVMTLQGHKSWVWWAAFSPDGKFIASGDENGTAKVWDVATGNEVLTLDRRGDEYYSIYSIAFSPDGKRIISCGEKIKVWDVATGNELMTLRGHGGYGWPVLPLSGRQGYAWSVAFSPDGTRIIAGCGNVKIWDAQTGAEVMTLRGLGSLVWPVSFSPDGGRIAAGSDDGTIKLWETVAPPGGYGPRRTAEAAREIVDELYEEHGFYSEVIDKLKADETLEESVRKVALQIANSRLWEDAEKLKKQNSDSAGPEEVPAEQKTKSR